MQTITHVCLTSHVLIAAGTKVVKFRNIFIVKQAQKKTSHFIGIPVRFIFNLTSIIHV